MTFTDAAVEVLRLIGKPLHYKDITAKAIEKNLLSHVGKSPEVTMGARLAALFKKADADIPLARIKPGVFGLKEWKGADAPAEPQATSASEQLDESSEPQVSEPIGEAATALFASTAMPKRHRGKPVQPAAESAAPAPVVPVSPLPPVPAVPASEPVAASAAPVEKAAATHAVPAPPDRGQGSSPRDADADARSELAAAGAEVFDEEEDDDKPIFGGPEPQTGDREGPRRSRRRRRRRGKGGPDGAGVGDGALPSYTVTPAFAGPDAPQAEPRASVAPQATGPSPVVVDVSGQVEGLSLDELGGRDMADGIAALLGNFDRGAGAVSLRQIAEASQRRSRSSGVDAQQLQSQIAAAVRADNIRRVSRGMRPRFRFSGGRISLTDWLLTPDLARMEQEALSAVERYRDASRRAFARKLQELPGHAFAELVLLVLESIGLIGVRTVRRAGLPPNEAHFCATHKTGAIDIPTALVIRRDSREVGRERVVELRGSLHHYGPASAGWIVTPGQVLSGAREEAGSTHTSSIALLDGYGIAKMCDKHNIAVVQTRMPIALPDVDLLEALRSS